MILKFLQKKMILKKNLCFDMIWYDTHRVYIYKIFRAKDGIVNSYTWWINTVQVEIEVAKINKGLTYKLCSK